MTKAGMEEQHCSSERQGSVQEWTAWQALNQFGADTVATIHPDIPIRHFALSPDGFPQKGAFPRGSCPEQKP